MGTPRYPSLYQINTSVWLTELSRSLGRPATLDDIPDAELDRSPKGFDWIWFLSVWQTGAAGSGSRAGTRIGGTNSRTRFPTSARMTSPVRLCHHRIRVHDRLGGDAALARLRERLRARGLRLLLDFVPNHMGPDHPWVEPIPSITSRARTTTWRARHRTTRGSRARTAVACSPMAAIRTSPAGPTPCS